MKLNLGCGADRKDGYVNADFHPGPGITVVDLARFPWPWADGEAEEVLMYDFLEHFPYRKTTAIIQECWRVLKSDGKLLIQVPDLEHCARAAANIPPFLCNSCGWQFPSQITHMYCENCHQPWTTCAESAIHRLYGGQNYEGNWHFTAFTKLQLEHLLKMHGFGDVKELEQEHQYKNWNFKLEARKCSDLWTWSVE